MMLSRNPATDEVLWEGPTATEQEVNTALKSARKALAGWSKLPLDKRRAPLKRFAELLKTSDLATIISKENGKPLWEAKTEVAAMVGKIDISIHAFVERCCEHRSSQSVTRYKPHGVVGVLGPFNFPGHLPNGHIVPALLAGNTVVFKPSELTPLVGEKLFSLWQEAGLADGVLNLIQGNGKTGKQLGEHPELDALFFTGSWTTGKKLSTFYGGHPEKLLALEMGGNNPLVVSDLDNIAAALLLIIQSAYLTAGQRCTCARRLITIGNEPLIEQLTAALPHIKVGAYDTEPFMGPVISREAAAELLEWQDQLTAAGGKQLVPMHYKEPAFLTPGLIDMTDAAERPDVEIFGPLLQLIRVPDLAAAIEEANRTQYGLSAGLISPHASEYERFYREVRAGIINWNTPLTGASSQAPFGGIGKSGNHRPSAYFAADYCSYPTASIEASKVEIPAHIPPGVPHELSRA